MKTIVLFILLSVVAITAKESEADKKARIAAIASAQKEVDALKQIKIEKTEQLEAMETKRWEARYAQNREQKVREDAARSQESKYSRRATDLSRINEGLISSKSLTRELLDKLEETQSQKEGLRMQIKQAVDKAADDLASDFPLGIESRTLTLGRAGEMASTSSGIGKSMEHFFEDRLFRYEMTLSQDLESRNSPFESQAEVPVWRLRFGTLFTAELEKDRQSKVQTLLRTGALQGKTFEWRSDLDPVFSKELEGVIRDAQADKKFLNIPMDVMQSKQISQAATKQDALSWKAATQKWFKTGGVVMYPLMAVAMLALLLALERHIAYNRRGRISNSFIKKVFELAENKKWTEARDFCLAQKTSLGNILYSILNHADDSRESAEKSVKESILREIPSLEKRLSVISALGSSAPLLGLLGTVSGMITLFKIITEAGTNDARILAGGISEALVTTQTGLIIAIPILLIHGYLAERMDEINSSLYAESLTLLNRMWPDSANTKI